jgi:hypothetical protein
LCEPPDDPPLALKNIALVHAQAKVGCAKAETGFPPAYRSNYWESINVMILDSKCGPAIAPQPEAARWRLESLNPVS